ncbi:hypothetical protein [Parasediminibacterium sp. JCM 36343]|uniref:hypothetical protein n=1 Tax=Parasediminibacterium sp. JCM 36343 TaxID=3374279 RepID=UPI0039782F93
MPPAFLMDGLGAKNTIAMQALTKKATIVGFVLLLVIGLKMAQAATVNQLYFWMGGMSVALLGSGFWLFAIKQQSSKKLQPVRVLSNK